MSVTVHEVGRLAGCWQLIECWWRDIRSQRAMGSPPTAAHVVHCVVQSTANHDCIRA